MTTTAGTAARQECLAFPSVKREKVGRVSVRVSMTARVLTSEQKDNPTIARAILRIRPPAERGSERQAEPEIRIDGLGRLLARWLQVGIGGHVGERPPAGRAATARVGLSRHGALLYPT